MQTPDAPEATPEKKTWIYVVVGLLAAALIAAGFFLLNGDEKGRTAKGPSRGAGIKQAHWKVRVKPVRGPALPDKKGKISKDQAKRMGKMIRNIYDAFYLRPQLIKDMTKRYMTPPAAEAAKRSQPHLPKKADGIKTLQRNAVIEIDSGTSRRAVAKVEVVATGENGGKRFRSATHDRLWLERSKGKWRVFAYDVNLDARPVKTGGDKKDGGKAEDKKDGGKPGAKGGKEPAKDGGQKKDGKGDGKKDRKGSKG
jgi:hypothetical protein